MNEMQHARADLAAARPSISGTVAAFLISILSVFACLLWKQYDHDLARENGPMENIEAACLMAGMLVLVWHARRFQLRPQRIVAAGFALLFGTFLVLEVDVRESDLRPLIIALNGRIRDLWLGSLWLGALLLFWRDKWSIWRLCLQWLRTSAGLLMLCAGALWIASAGVDKALIVDKDLFLEELLEVPATILMLASALHLGFTPEGAKTRT